MSVAIDIGAEVKVKDLGTSKWAKRRNGRKGQVVRAQVRTVMVVFTDNHFPEYGWFYSHELEDCGTEERS